MARARLRMAFVGALAIGLIAPLALGRFGAGGGPGGAAGASGGNAPGGTSGASRFARLAVAGKVGGTELYGYLPYWAMTASMADYLATVPLTTIELFSVTAHTNGSLDNKLSGYRRIT